MGKCAEGFSIYSSSLKSTRICPIQKKYVRNSTDIAPSHMQISRGYLPSARKTPCRYASKPARKKTDSLRQQIYHNYTHHCRHDDSSRTRETVSTTRRLLSYIRRRLPRKSSRACRPRPAPISTGAASPTQRRRTATPPRSTASCAETRGCGADAIACGSHDGDAVRVGNGSGGGGRAVRQPAVSANAAAAAVVVS